MKAPFPYFGGKSKVAHLVWEALGDCVHYIEPFFGSGAVLLSRPKSHRAKMETVNDADGHVANVWRSIHFSPDEVAKWCDWPVNHVDLEARRKVLIANEERLLENLVNDPEWHDPKMAGYWIWAASCWIGHGLTRPGSIPHISNAGSGINAQIPHLSDAGKGINAKRPHLSDAGKGINAKSTGIYEWMSQLAARLRRVRVVCGDWTRVCGGNWQDSTGVCGIFFDPPYGEKANRAELYAKESFTVADEVAKWALERGRLPSYRIVILLCPGLHALTGPCA